MVTFPLMAGIIDAYYCIQRVVPILLAKYPYMCFVGTPFEIFLQKYAAQILAISAFYGAISVKYSVALNKRNFIYILIMHYNKKGVPV